MAKDPPRETYEEMMIRLEDPMRGETFADMYERLEKEMGGEPFMPSYAYESRDEQIKALERLKNMKGIKNNPRSSKTVNKKLKRARKYMNEGGLVPGKRKIARGCGKVQRRKKTLYT